MRGPGKGERVREEESIQDGERDGHRRTCPYNYAFRGQSEQRIEKYMNRDVRSLAAAQRHFGTK